LPQISDFFRYIAAESLFVFITDSFPADNPILKSNHLKCHNQMYIRLALSGGHREAAVIATEKICQTKWLLSRIAH
jgi:hypothetical protein